MDYSTPIYLHMRWFLGNKLGLLRPMVRFIRRVRRARYEERFDAALLKSISPSDTVWDIGANKGYYTGKMVDLVSAGSIIAFEPSPKTFGYLKEIFGTTPNVHLENVALAGQDGEASFFVSDSSGEDSLFNRPNGSRACVLVRTAKAD